MWLELLSILLEKPYFVQELIFFILAVMSKAGAMYVQYQQLATCIKDRVA